MCVTFVTEMFEVELFYFGGGGGFVLPWHGRRGASAAEPLPLYLWDVRLEWEHTVEVGNAKDRCGEGYGGRCGCVGENREAVE